MTLRCGVRPVMCEVDPGSGMSNDMTSATDDGKGPSRLAMTAARKRWLESPRVVRYPRLTQLLPLRKYHY